MAPTTGRRRIRQPVERRRELLLDAATAVFAEHGFRGASQSRIAREAGVAKSLLYHHFASKDELYLELIEIETARLVEHLRRATAADLDPARRLRALLESFFSYVQERPFARQLLFRELDGDPAIAEAENAARGRMTAVIVDVLAADPRLLDSDPDRARAVELFGQLVATALNGLAVWWWSNPGVDRAEVVERGLQLLWSGLSQLRSPEAGDA